MHVFMYLILFRAGQSSLGRRRLRRKERQYLEFAFCNEEHGNPYRWCGNFEKLLELCLTHLHVTGQPLEFKDLKSAAFMASDG
jgi:hypothetical protein